MKNNRSRVGQYAWREQIVKEAMMLRSEHGENPEYDRALCELIYWTFGGGNLRSIAEEIGIVNPRWADHVTAPR